jgi:hypothetical protein
MPPPWLRRPLTVTLWLIAAVACVVASPVLLALAAAASAITRRRQAMVLARLLISYFLRELAALIACGALWIVSGAGWRMRTRRFQRVHWQLLRWLVGGIAALGLSLLDIDVAEELPPDAARALDGDEPLIIFSRHAGPGDTVLLIDRLLSRFDRRPSVVLQEALVLDPSVDLITHRLPHAVLDTGDREDSLTEVQTVAGNLGPRGVLLLFPEGGNFTHERRRSTLIKLRRKGQRLEAERAEQLSHVLPARPSGALAALRGKPSADVIFAAHTGLGLAAYPREIWRDMPLGRTLRTRMWVVPAADLPAGADERVTWLNQCWTRIDQWIEQQQTGRG